MDLLNFISELTKPSYTSEGILKPVPLVNLRAARVISELAELQKSDLAGRIKAEQTCRLYLDEIVRLRDGNVSDVWCEHWSNEYAMENQNQTE